MPPSIALQDWGDPSELYSFIRTAPGVWTGPTLTITGSSFANGAYSLGAVVAALSTTLGIIADAAPHDLIFAGNGPPFTPVSITAGLYSSPGYYEFLPANYAGLDFSVGAFYYGGAYFVFLIGLWTDGSHFEVRLLCVNSTDGGNTWSAPLDDSNGILLYTTAAGYVNSNIIVGPTPYVQPGLHWDGISPTVDVFSPYSYLGAGSPKAAIWKFNFSTSKWGMPIGSITLSGALFFKKLVHRFQNGDLAVVYNYITPSQGPPIFRLFSGSSWGSEIGLTSKPNEFYVTYTPDASDAFLHMFTETGDGLGGFTADYYQLAHNGSISSSLFTFPDYTFSEAEGLGQVAISEDGYLLVPYPDNDVDFTGAVWEAPVGGPYAFTKYLLPAVAGAGPPPTGRRPSGLAVWFYGPTIVPFPPTPPSGLNRILPQYIKRKHIVGL